jgi:hypothetical protein
METKHSQQYFEAQEKQVGQVEVVEEQLATEALAESHVRPQCVYGGELVRTQLIDASWAVL